MRLKLDQISNAEVLALSRNMVVWLISKRRSDFGFGISTRGSFLRFNYTSRFNESRNCVCRSLDSDHFSTNLHTIEK